MIALPSHAPRLACAMMRDSLQDQWEALASADPVSTCTEEKGCRALMHVLKTGQNSSSAATSQCVAFADS